MARKIRDRLGQPAGARGDGSAALWLAATASPRTHRGGHPPSSAPVRGSIDPALAFAPDEWSLDSMVYDGLVTFRRVGGTAGASVVADLATGMPTATANGKSYTFTLRPDLHYANGAPVRAVDFRHALERVLKMPQPPPYNDGIRGAGPCVRKPKTCDLSRGVATDEATRTITIQLKAPDADFLYKLALPFGAVIPSGTPSGDLSHRAPPGTGPTRSRASGQGQRGSFGTRDSSPGPTMPNPTASRTRSPW